MTDNLKEMIYDNQDENTESEEIMSTEKVEEHIEITVTPTEEKIENTEVVSKINNMFNTINFYDWFIKYSTHLTNIRHVKLSCKGLNATDTIVFLIPHSSGENIPEQVLVDGVETTVNYPRQKLIVKEDANSHMIPDIEPCAIQFFNADNFICHWNLSDNNHLSVYFRKKQAFYVFLKMTNDLLIPYKVEKYDTKLKQFSMVDLECDLNLQSTLSNTTKESTMILYQQIQKYISEFNTKEDIIKWFLERKKTVEDIHHLLVIDNLIISIIND